MLPLLSFAEALETTKVHSIAGILVPGAGLVRQRPFRAPHHSISDARLLGGGLCTPHPGEVSLSHNGVLFLDEFPEFPRNVLELLRQPPEDGSVTIARSTMRCRIRNCARTGRPNPQPRFASASSGLAASSRRVDSSMLTCRHI